MSLDKTGSPNKIEEIAKSAAEFSTMWQKIEKKNDLIKCLQCGHLISKRLENNITIKHKKLSAIIKTGEVSLVCPNCNTVNNITIK